MPFHRYYSRVMGNMRHQEIAEALIDLLAKREIKAYLTTCASGSVYVHVEGSAQRVRIANHRKHRGWFRYNIRTDLKQGREFYFKGQRVFIYTQDEIQRASYRIARDSKNDWIRHAHAIITRKPARRR